MTTLHLLTAKRVSTRGRQRRSRDAGASHAPDGQQQHAGADPDPPALHRIVTRSSSILGWVETPPSAFRVGVWTNCAAQDESGSLLRRRYDFSHDCTASTRRRWRNSRIRPTSGRETPAYRRPAPPLARFAPAASTKAAVSAPSNRVLHVVQCGSPSETPGYEEIRHRLRRGAHFRNHELPGTSGVA
jgi:hypothetical protein